MTTTTPSAGDGRPRCAWGDADDRMTAYHDAEWGRPVTDERGLFERVSLEAFQSGLSWSLVLRRRPSLRAAFAGFDPDVLAGWGDEDAARALDAPGMIRNRAKVQAVVANARAVVALRAAGTPLPALVWSHRPVSAPPVPAVMEDVPATTPGAAALARELRRAGFKFVGPTTAYAAMQACGLVNDHLAGCWVRDEVEAARRAVSPA